MDNFIIRTELEKVIIHECANTHARSIQAVEKLTEADFSLPEHRIIFKAIRKIVKNNETPDYYTIIRQCEKDGASAPDVIASYLSSIQGDILLNAHNDFENHLNELKSRADTDKLNNICREAQSRINDGARCEEVAPYIRNAIEDMHRERAGGVVHISEALAANTERIEKEVAAKKNGISLYVPSGFPHLDRMTGGFKNGQMIILGARTGIGKTSFAFKAATEAAKKGKRVLYISREMSAEDMAARYAALYTSVDMKKISSSDISDNEMKELKEFSDKQESVNLYIDDSTGSIDKIKIIALSLKARKGLDFIVIDYLQLLDREKGINEVQAIDNLARELKLLAMNLKVPVLVLSQLNNEADTDTEDDNKPAIPKMANLRGSGAISQNADAVLFLCRNRSSNTAKLVIAKGRNIGTGVLNLYFNGEKTEYTEMASDDIFSKEVSAEHERGDQVFDS